MKNKVKVYGSNHIAIEVTDVDKAIEFYQDVFNLEKLDWGEGDAFFKLGEHQFLAIFKVDSIQKSRVRHFGIIVHDEEQIKSVREKLTKKYKIEIHPGISRCEFHDPWGNLIQVVDLYDESTVWLEPYQEVGKVHPEFPK